MSKGVLILEIFYFEPKKCAKSLYPQRFNQMMEKLRTVIWHVLFRKRLK